MSKEPNTQELQALFNNSTIGIVITNSDGIIINFNPYAEKIFGYNKEEILNQPVEVLVPASLSRKHVAYRDEFIAHPQNRIMGAGRDLYARRKDNSEFPVELSLSHYMDNNSIFVIAFVVDISIRKANDELVIKQKEELVNISSQIMQMNVELEKKIDDRTKMLKETFVELENSKDELRMALEKEKELSELKSRFVTMASHEFRTPLSAILSSAYIVQQYETKDDQEKRSKHLIKIQNAVQALTFVLEDFLSLEKLEEGYVKVNLQLMTSNNIQDEIEGVLEQMRQILKKGQIFRFTRAQLTEITCDKNLFRNILVNLISNAIKYSPDDAAIEINCWVESSYLKIAITDHGIGIPEEDQKHLYERFFRASNTNAVQGTGLGLHIVKRYLKLLRGSIELKSELYRGTTVTVLLDTKMTI